MLCVHKLPAAGMEGGGRVGVLCFRNIDIIPFETEPILNHKSSFIVDINQLMIIWPNWQWRVPETGRITASRRHTHTHTLGFTHQSLTRAIPLWANKPLRSSPSLWEMLYIFLCHPGQKQASDLERATQRWLLLWGVNISVGSARATAGANACVSNVCTAARNDFRLSSHPCGPINSSHRRQRSKGRCGRLNEGNRKLDFCTKFRWPAFSKPL